MSHLFELADEQYEKLAAYAVQQKQTPETLFQIWVSEVTHNIQPSPSYNSTEQMVREVHEEREAEVLNSPLLQIAGMFAIGEPGWADKHDEYLAEAYIENHANEH